MGVPSFYRWLTINKEKYKCKNVIIDEFVVKPDVIDYFMIDGNGSFHMCLKYIIDEFKDGNKNNRIKNIDNPRKEIIQQTIKSFTELVDYMISVLDCKHVFIAVDGVAPVAKISQQRQRRYKYLFDSKLKSESSELYNTSSKLNKNMILEPNIPLRSIELTPGTDLMETMHLAIKNYVKKYDNKNIKMMYSSYHSEGEGEHKILQYIKQHISSDKTIIIYGLDADLIFLSLSIGKNYNIYIMREAQIFKGEEVNLTETIAYNYIDVSKLHILIENIGISTNDFILLCFLVGNDFIPRLISIDIKKHGLDKIIDTFLRTFQVQLTQSNNENSILVREYIENNKKIFKINHGGLLHFLRKLQWTEKFVWSNINRKKNENVDNNKLMNDYISGKTENVEFLDRIQFSSKSEFYNYYLGISTINEVDIKNIVNNYMTGIEWCFHYYFNKCPSFTTFSYNFLIAPLIEDIVNYYPKEIIIKKDTITLKPVEQLLIAIPFDTYKYVIEESIIDKFKNNLEIGYMMPLNFNIDVNKESVYWKCSVKIPPIEYYDFIHGVNKLKIENSKNTILTKLYQNTK
jgi:5'-3' exonuclease